MGIALSSTLCGSPEKTDLGGVGPYKAYPVLVGDIMPWCDFIPAGTGKWYHLLDYLNRKMAASRTGIPRDMLRSPNSVIIAEALPIDATC